MNFEDVLMRYKKGVKISRPGKRIAFCEGACLYEDDVLADDWEIVALKEPEMDFSEALKKMKEGYAVRRLSWVPEVESVSLSSDRIKQVHFIWLLEDDWIIDRAAAEELKHAKCPAGFKFSSDCGYCVACPKCVLLSSCKEAHEKEIAV